MTDALWKSPTSSRKKLVLRCLPAHPLGAERRKRSLGARPTVDPVGCHSGASWRTSEFHTSMVPRQLADVWLMQQISETWKMQSKVHLRCKSGLLRKVNPFFFFLVWEENTVLLKEKGHQIDYVFYLFLTMET